MFKKIITMSLFSVSALALVNANAVMLPDTAQNVKKDNKSFNAASAKHKISPVVERFNEKTDNISQVQTVSVPCSQVPVGMYVSGQIGYADTHLHVQVPGIIASGNSISDGIAGRLALGYKIAPNAALEVGLLQLKGGEVKSGNYTLSSNQYALDIAAKGSLPLTHDVNLYGKVGAAYLTTRLQQDDGKYTVNVNDVNGIAKHKWAPEVAVGVSYDITPNVNVDTSFTHIHPVGNNRPGNIDFLAVGVGYTFG